METAKIMLFLTHGCPYRKTLKHSTFTSTLLDLKHVVDAGRPRTQSHLTFHHEKPETKHKKYLIYSNQTSVLQMLYSKYLFKIADFILSIYQAAYSLLSNSSALSHYMVLVGSYNI